METSRSKVVFIHRARNDRFALKRLPLNQFYCCYYHLYCDWYHLGAVKQLWCREVAVGGREAVSRCELATEHLVGHGLSIKQASLEGERDSSAPSERSFFYQEWETGQCGSLPRFLQQRSSWNWSQHCVKRAVKPVWPPLKGCVFVARNHLAAVSDKLAAQRGVEW